MPEYIEREALRQAIKGLWWVNKSCEYDALKVIKQAPTANVVEVTRCAECRHYNPSCMPNGFGWCEYYNSGATDEHYCSHGERKGE